MKLTKRQSELVCELSKGLSNKAIARNLNVTEGTVKMMLHLLYAKTGTANRTALVMQCALAESGKAAEQIIALSPGQAATAPARLDP
jgi:DNA-binding NarL/FixJ family response regulator